MKQRNIFNTINPESNIWIRNPNHFLKNFDLSGVAVSCQNSNLKSGVLISNRHVLFARHITGEKFVASFDIKFVNNKNEVFTYTVAYLKYDIIANTDIGIGYLNQTIDSSLCFYKVLPSTFDNYYGKMIDPSGSGSEMPVVFIDQNKNLSIGDARFDRQNTGSYYNASYIWKIFASYNDAKYQYAEKTITNDSGNAILAILNNELVVLGTWWLGGSSSRLPIDKGANIGDLNAIHKYTSSINSLMTSLAGSSYSLSPIATNFKTYSGTKIPSIRIGSVYEKNMYGYDKAPLIQGVTQETSTVYLYDDEYPLGTVTPSSLLEYSFNVSSPYLGLTTNGISGKASIAGNESQSTDIIAYTAMSIPAPVVISRSNTTDRTPTISGTWTQNRLTTNNENIEIDIYDDNVKISNQYDVLITDTDTVLSQNWSYTPSSDLSIGFHTIKAKAKTAENGINVSSFSNSITFEIIDSGGS